MIQADVEKTPKYAVTRNACKLCTPLGASLVFKGIRGAVSLLHGSQGCSTYIRRYLISHYKEPIDIACSNFAEETAIFGGGANLKIALENIRLQYAPEMIGVSTTCLSETIGDDVPMFIKEYRNMCADQELPPVVHVATPSYSGTHVDGFHGAVKATVAALATGEPSAKRRINLFPGMLSPADIRYLKEILDDYHFAYTLLPDYTETLDGSLWTEYQRIPPGGTRVSDIQQTGSALATLELGRILGSQKETAGKLLEKRFGVPCHSLGLPMGIHETDRFFQTMENITGWPLPEKYAAERGRLIDSYADGHKYVIEARAVVYGEEDMVVGLVAFLSEIGVKPVLCATGGKSGHLRARIAEIIPDYEQQGLKIMDGADFVDIEAAARTVNPDLMIGNSKGYTLARQIKVPMIRVGFPIHDRVGGSRLLHIGYRGAQQLFDRIANTIIENRQDTSDWGHTYM